MSEYTFIHIPRNGGTSIKRFINNLGISRTIAHDRQVWSKNIHVPPVHIKKVETEGNNKKKAMTEVIVPYSPENIQRLVLHKTRCSDAVGRAVVVIRDPIDRVKSLYKFWRFGNDKKRRRRLKMGMKEQEILTDRTIQTSRSVESFIEMFSRQEVSEENSNGGTFVMEHLLPQSHWINIDLDNEEARSKLIVVPFCKNVAEKINHEDFVDNTDIVSSVYNIIKGSKTMRECDHANFRKRHVEYTETKLNECSKDIEAAEDRLFTDRELTYFMNYYKTDFDMIEKLRM